MFDISARSYAYGLLPNCIPATDSQSKFVILASGKSLRTSILTAFDKNVWILLLLSILLMAFILVWTQKNNRLNEYSSKYSYNFIMIIQSLFYSGKYNFVFYSFYKNIILNLFGRFSFKY